MEDGHDGFGKISLFGLYGGGGVVGNVGNGDRPGSLLETVEFKEDRRLLV